MAESEELTMGAAGLAGRLVYKMVKDGDLDSLADELALYTGMMWGDVLDGLAEALMDKAEEMLREAER